MNEEKIDKYKERLERFKYRYLVPALNVVMHYSQCGIYKPKEMYGFAVCDCGLLFDLTHHLHFLDGRKLFPPKWTEGGDQERTHEEQVKWDARTEEEKESQRQECLKILEDAFNKKIDDPTPEEIAYQDQEDAREWELITEVFGPDFRDATERRYGDGEKPSNFWDTLGECIWKADDENDESVSGS